MALHHGKCPTHANFGDIGGMYCSKLDAGHLDRHLTQRIA
jgi:hypothetical protein